VARPPVFDPEPSPPDEAPIPARYRIALLAAGALWSLGGLFIKALSAHPAWHSSALGITFHRSLFAGLCLLPLLRGRRVPKAREIGVTILLYTGLLILYVASTQGTSAANAIFLQYTAPLYAAVLGPWFFHERFRRGDGVALAGSMAGIAVLFFGGFRGREQWPLVMGAGSGVMFGLLLLWLRRLRHADPVAVTCLNNLGVAALVAGALAVVRPQELALVPSALTVRPELLGVALPLALMGAVQIAAPYVLFSHGLRRVSSVEAGLLALVEPVLNPVWVALFYGERPTGATLVGGALIVASLAARYTLFPEPRVGPDQAAAPPAG
jgi:DME family drug/metabolite transporter